MDIRQAGGHRETLPNLSPLQAALTTFEELGATYLKPVFEQLDGRVGYEDLKLLRLRFMAD